MSRNSSVVACVLLLALLSGCASAPISQQPTSSPNSSAQTPAPSSTARRSPLPDFTHIYVLLMENKESESVIGSSAAPYINSLAQQYDMAANFFGTTHPSLPNYLELLGGIWDRTSSRTWPT